MNAVVSPTGTRPNERRAHARHPVHLPARIGLLGYEVEGRLEDIGSGGVCFVTDDRTLVVEAANFVSVSFSVTIEGARHLVERAIRVVYVREREVDSARERVIGLEFEEPLPLEGVDLLSSPG